MVPALLKKGHSPNLETIKMVEAFIREHSGEFHKTDIWKTLPKQVEYPTYNKIINYLEESVKIASDKEGKICWIHNPDLVRRYLAREDLKVR
jgi:hypothetical protein